MLTEDMYINKEPHKQIRGKVTITALGKDGSKINMVFDKERARHKIYTMFRELELHGDQTCTY